MQWSDLEMELFLLQMGYRHIDTASGYHNELLVGEALQEAFRLQLVTREELFVTTKLGPDDMAPLDIIPSLQSSLRYRIS